MKRLSKLFKGLIYVLPVVLFFSYYPVFSFGSDETMNFELSLPLIWLVLFDLLVLVMSIIKRGAWRDILKGWKWLLFPVFVTLSVMWSLNVVRGVLTVGIMWLIVFAIYGMWKMRDLIQELKFRENFWKWLIVSTLVACGWCVLQCVLDVLSVSPEYSLLCPGCVSQMFGFPHPNGFAIEPQFMGNLLLVPAIVVAWLYVKKSNYTGFLGLKWLLGYLFVIVATLFLTFSRGAIYAFSVGMIFMSAFILAREKRKRKEMVKRVGVVWGMTIFSFLFTLNVQGVLAEVGPTNATYGSGVARVVNHLSLGIIDVRYDDSEDANVFDDADDAPVFDGYVEESTNVRLGLTKSAIKVWLKDFRTTMFGVGIGGAGQAMYDEGLTGSPKEIVQNEYASLLAELGVVGVVLAVMVIFMIVKLFAASSSNALLLTLVMAYGVSLLFFAGFANALQIYLLPMALYNVLRKKLVS